MKRDSSAFPQIPDKIYFRIGEVSQLVGVDSHVLRYWESEFSLIRPFRGPSKQRLYRRQDVLNLLRIKQLLHDEGFTISGARKQLKTQNTEQGIYDELVQKTESSEKQPLLSHLKQELQNILTLLGDTKKGDS